MNETWCIGCCMVLFSFSERSWDPSKPNCHGDGDSFPVSFCWKRVGREVRDTVLGEEGIGRSQRDAQHQKLTTALLVMKRKGLVLVFGRLLGTSPCCQWDLLESMENNCLRLSCRKNSCPKGIQLLSKQFLNSATRQKELMPNLCTLFFHLFPACLLVCILIRLPVCPKGS